MMVATPIASKFKVRLVTNSVAKPSFHKLINAWSVSLAEGKKTKGEKIHSKSRKPACTVISNVAVDLEMAVLGAKIKETLQSNV
jgi:hypothetical protein